MVDSCLKSNGCSFAVPKNDEVRGIARCPSRCHVANDDDIGTQQPSRGILPTPFQRSQQMLLASSSEESLEGNTPGDQFVPLVAGVSRWDYSDDDAEYALVRRKRAPEEAPAAYFFTKYWNKFKHWKDDHHIFFAKVIHTNDIDRSFPGSA